MTTAIAVDSAASLPRELVARYGIQVVPMTVVIDGRSRPDTEVTTEELLAELGKRYPHLEETMLSALKNDAQYSLWEKAPRAHAAADVELDGDE